MHLSARCFHTSWWATSSLLVAMDRVLTWVQEETRILYQKKKKKRERRLGEY